MSNKKSTDKVLDFLLGTLKSMYITADEDYQLLADYPDNKQTPVIASMSTDKGVKKLPIYLPADDIVKQQNKGKRLIYFPFAESIFNGNSEMLNLTIRAINSRLHGSTLALVEALLKSAVDTDNADYGNEVIKVLKGLNIKKTLGKQVIRLVKSARSVKPYGPSSLLAIKMTRDVPEGVSYIRQADIRLVDTEKETLFGDNPTQQVRDILSDLLSKIFNDKDTGGYVAKSSSRMCPSYFTLLKSFALVADRINEVAKDLGTYKDDTIFINDSWFSMLEKEAELEKFHSRYIINKFEGNIGLAKKGSANEVEQNQGNTPMARPKRNFTSEPSQQPEQQQQFEDNHNYEPEPQEEAANGGVMSFFTPGANAKVAPPSDTDAQPQQTQRSGHGTNYSTAQPQQQHGGYNARPLEPQRPTPQQQSQQQYGGGNNSSRPTINVLPPSKPMGLRKVHLHDTRGVALYWQNGEPYTAEASCEVIPNTVWRQDYMGNYMFTASGEPDLVETNGQAMPGQSGFGHPAMNTPNGNLPSQQDLAAMPYTQRIYWEDKIAQAQSQAQQYNNYGNGNQGYGGYQQHNNYGGQVNTGFSNQASNTGFGHPNSGNGFSGSSDRFSL